MTRQTKRTDNTRILNQLVKKVSEKKSLPDLFFGLLRTEFEDVDWSSVCCCSTTSPPSSRFLEEEAELGAEETGE